MARTYEEHLQLAKDRANELLAKGEATEAVISMMSDLKDHHETRGLVEGILLSMGLLALTEASRGNVVFAKDYINGFH